MSLLIKLFLFVCLSATPFSLALDNGLALAPAMGFSTWNTFGGAVSDALLRQTADAMASNGLLDAGYEYLNLVRNLFSSFQAQHAPPRLTSPYPTATG